MKLINVILLLSLLSMWGCNEDDDPVVSKCQQLETAMGMSFSSVDLDDFSASCTGNGAVTIAYSAEDGEDTSFTCKDGTSVNASGITGSSIVIDYSNVTMSGSQGSGTASYVVDLGATVNSTAVRCEMTISIDMATNATTGMESLSCEVDGSTVTLGSSFYADDCAGASNATSELTAIAQLLGFFNYLAQYGNPQ